MQWVYFVEEDWTEIYKNIGMNLVNISVNHSINSLNLL